MQENWKEYLESEKKKYKKLGQVRCPTFSNEEVCFNHYGWQHLISKGKKLRPKADVMHRFHLLQYVPNILKKLKRVDGEEKRIEATSIAYFWTIKWGVGNTKIRIVLRRLNNGTLHFFSVMEE